LSHAAWRLSFIRRPTRTGFREIEVRRVPAPLRMTSAVECVRFERESFGALHQRLSGLDEPGPKPHSSKSRQLSGNLKGQMGSSALANC
jgi:hypothetical protein